MTDKDKAKKTYELCKEFGYLGRNSLSFEELYELAVSDQSLNASVDRKILLLLAELAIKPSMMDEWDYHNKREVNQLDMISGLIGFALGVGGTLLALRLVGNSRNSSAPDNRSPPSAKPFSQEPAAIPKPVPVTPPRPKVLLLATEISRVQDKLPALLSGSTFTLVEEDKDTFYKMNWFMLPDQDPARVQTLKSTLHPSSDTSGYVVLSVELTDMTGFQKGAPNKREGFSKLVQKRFSVLGTLKEMSADFPFYQ